MRCGHGEGVKVVFNVTDRRAAPPDVGSGGSDAVATDEWVKRLTHRGCRRTARPTGTRPPPWTPSSKGAGVCRFPAGQPAHRDDKDHVQNYDHDDPDVGGPTATGNFNARVVATTT